jgi:methionine--tRNA ligase beta chain
MDLININDFQKVDIRIGRVIEATVPEWSHWVMKLTVDLGEEIGRKTIFSGIMKFFKPDDLLNRQFPFVVNLEPKRIGPKDNDGNYNFSEGMMIMAVPSEDEDTPPVLFNLEEEVPNGTKIR